MIRASLAHVPKYQKSLADAFIDLSARDAWMNTDFEKKDDD